MIIAIKVEVCFIAFTLCNAVLPLISFYTHTANISLFLHFYLVIDNAHMKVYIIIIMLYSTWQYFHFSLLFLFFCRRRRRCCINETVSKKNYKFLSSIFLRTPYITFFHAFFLSI